MSAASPAAISSMRIRCGCAAYERRAQVARASRTAACAPSTSDSARRIAQSSRASPGGNAARFGHLHAALGVDVGAGLFRIGGARQDHVGAMRAAVAMGAEIDDEGARPRCRSRRRRAGTDTSSAARPAIAAAVLPPSPGTKPRSSAPTREAACAAREKPFQPSLTTPTSRGEPWRPARHRRAVRPRQRAGADDHQRPLGALERFGELAVGELARASPAPAPR